MRELWRLYRTEVILFTVGSVFFVGGLVNLLVSNSSSNVGPAARPSVTSAAPLPRVGPPTAGPVAEYVAGRKKLLAARASQSAGAPAVGVVSFETYRTVDEALAVLGGRKSKPLEVQVRVPLEGFEPETVDLGDRSAAEAVVRWRRSKARELSAEAEELERLIPTVDDREFREVYSSDAERRRKAVAVLEADNPGIVFALVVGGSNYSDLRRIAQVPGVRLVDVADDQAATRETHSFAGVLPEQT